MVVFQASSSKPYNDQSEPASQQRPMGVSCTFRGSCTREMSMIASQTLTISSIDLCVFGLGPGDATHLACHLLIDWRYARRLSVQDLSSKS